MTQDTKQERLNDTFSRFMETGRCRSKKEFARLLGVNYNGLIRAFAGEAQYLTDSLLAKVAALDSDNGQLIGQSGAEETVVPLIPTGARAGTLADFALTVKEYDVEKIISPIKGADYAIQVTGDSMVPEYDPGCHVLIKRINEEQFIEWGKAHVLDTDNGAVLKKIYPTEDPEVVECRSINPAYPPFTVNTRHIHGWYRVLMCMALK